MPQLRAGARSAANAGRSSGATKQTWGAELAGPQTRQAEPSRAELSAQFALFELQIRVP